MRIHFGEFALDRETRQLFRGDEELHLKPKAFDLLDFLLSQKPRVLSRERIRDRLWPGTFVSESTLATVVNEVRGALADDPKRPRFIRTLRGHGYAFFAETAAAASEAPRSLRRGVSFRLVLDDREVALHEGENLLGREEDGVLWIDAPTVSRRHARIVVTGASAVLEDLGSKNGTHLKGVRLTVPVPLSDGDEIWLGQVPVTFPILASGGPTRTAR
ncbi:MAG TPA: winged helix-turn-helix domain-containing protein [Vicinamibacteria bacterium]|nr:winged helix-turn-helix domain-containing protein [Vicinamibacteria bacterium]